MFNPEAWTSKVTTRHWLKYIYKPATAYPAGNKEPRLLGPVAITGHNTQPIMDELKNLHCTGYVQVLILLSTSRLKHSSRKLLTGIMISMKLITMLGDGQPLESGKRYSLIG